MSRLCIRTVGTEFLPLAHPIREAQVNCPVDSHNGFDLFQLSFPDEQIQILVDNTNKNAKMARRRQGAHGGGTDREGREIRGWIDTNVKELYAFFGVYVYEGVHPESRLTDYWQVNEDGNHSQVKNAISLNRFEQSNRFFHISDPNDLPKPIETRGKTTVTIEKFPHMKR